MKTKATKRQITDQVAQEDRCGKKQSFGIYRDGQQMLFVPQMKIWKLREMFATEAKGDREPAVRTTLRTRSRDARELNSLTSQVNHWLKRYDSVEFFRSWLLAGQSPPPEVKVPREDDVREAAAAWNVGALSERTTDVRDSSKYDAWFGRQLLPVEQIEQWALWLFGGPDPEDWLIVPYWTVKLRDELAPPAICRAANIAQGTLYDWKNHAAYRRALADACDAAWDGSVGPPRSASWNALFDEASALRKLREEKAEHARRLFAKGGHLDEVASAAGLSRTTAHRIKSGGYRVGTPAREWTRDCMLAFAKHSTIPKALKRVRDLDANRLDAPGSLGPLREKARELGVWEPLLAWLREGLDNVVEPSSSFRSVARRRGEWRRSGVVTTGARIYVPSSPVMWEFRQAAKGWLNTRLYQLVRDDPCYRLWFLDAVLPSRCRGKPSPYRQAIGLDRGRRKAYRNDPDTWKAYQAKQIAETDGAETPRAADPSPSNHAPPPDALALCNSDGQRKIVTAVAQLTAGRPDYWPLAKEVAKSAGCANNPYFRGELLPKLVGRGALMKRDRKNGYRLA